MTAEFPSGTILGYPRICHRRELKGHPFATTSRSVRPPTRWRSPSATKGDCGRGCRRHVDRGSAQSR